MKKLLVLLFALVITAGTAYAQCTQPPLGTVVNLSDVTLTNGGNMVDVGILVNDRIVRDKVTKDRNFCVELVSRDAFWVKYRVIAYCEGSDWIPVQNTPLTLKRTERQPEPIILPPSYVVKPGDNWATVEKATGAPQDSLIKWNGLDGKVGRKRNHVLPGEHLFTAAPADNTVIRRWEFLKGAPAKKKLLAQIEDPRVPVPKYVKSEWKSLIEASSPDTVRMYSSVDRPLFHDFICYGDDVVWLKTVCFWKDPITLEPITMTLALEYPPVDYQGKRYYLYQYLACNNAAGSIIPIVDEATTEVDIPPPPTDTQRPTSSAPPVTYQAPPPRETSHEFVQGGVIWADARLAYADVQPRRDSRQYSYFGGLEWLPRISGYDGWGPFKDASAVVRIEQASMDKNHVSGDYRLGGRAWLIGGEQGLWRTGFEGGAWYQAAQRNYLAYTPISIGRVRVQEKARYFDGYGLYGRVLGLTPAEGYYEVTLKGGTNLARQLNANFTIEPAKLYFRASYDAQYRKGQSRHFEGTTLSFPADTMKVVELRLGVKPVKQLVLYISYDIWDYNSPPWSFDWKGWGPGVEYRINRWWRVKGFYKYLNDTSDRDLITGTVTHTDRHWFGVGIDHGW